MSTPSELDRLAAAYPTGYLIAASNSLLRAHVLGILEHDRNERDLVNIEVVKISLRPTLTCMREQAGAERT